MDTVIDRSVSVSLFGEKLIGKMTMRSFAVYRELTGRSLLADIPAAIGLEEGIVLAVLSSCLYRPGSEEPVGEWLYGASEQNKVSAVLMAGRHVAEIIINCLPENDGTGDSKKKMN